MNSFIIIGGGISGLYTAYKLINKFGENVNITIYEKSNKFGGKINTIHKNGLIFEAGAGRFSNYHNTLLKLIYALKIEDKIIQFPHTDTSYIKDSKEFVFDSNAFIEKLLILETKFSKNILKSKTLLFFMKENFPPSVVDDFINAFGYNNEFEYGNAYDILQRFKLKKPFYYLLQGGMYTIVENLLAFLKTKNVTLKLNESVYDIDIKNGKVNDKKYDMIFLCIAKNELLNIPSLDSDINLQRTLDTIHTRPLNRIYAKFPNESDGKVWFSNIPKICTNNVLRNIIPIDIKKGLIMITYSDGLYAEIWNSYKNKKDLVENIMVNVRQLFNNKKISDPIWIEKYYWENATHWPGPYYRMYKNKAEKYRICGEVIQRSFNGWIEGALLSVENVFKTI